MNATFPLALPRVVALVVFTMISIPAAAFDADAAGLAFVKALSQGRFDEAAKTFDPTMSAALPPPKLAATWKELQGQVGAFRSTGSVRHEPAGPYTVVFVRCLFDGGELDTKIIYSSDGKVAGLFFVPPTMGSTWAAPSYGDESKVREIDVVVGKEWPLVGKLTLPAGAQGKVRAVVLVHGSGPHDLDETIGPNKPFKDLALGLANRGIAVIRYDKRTKAHGARLVKEVSAFTIDDETVNDAVAAVELAASRPEIDPAHIYVLGHSLGGTAAPRIQARSKIAAGIIVLGGSTRALGDIVVDQLSYIAGLDGATDAPEAKQIESAKAFRSAAAAPGLKPDATLDLLGGKLPGSYILDLRAYDPAKIAAGLPQRMLILQGGRDYQVTIADFNGWKRGLAQKKNVTFRVFEKMNHLFIAGEGKSTPAEYERPGHVDVSVVEAISDWIRQ